MNHLSFLMFAALVLCSCGKTKRTLATVTTEIEYSHVDGPRKAMARRQELGTISPKTPASSARLTLNDKSEVWFNQSTDATDPAKIQVTVESWVTGGTPEVKILNFNYGKPSPTVVEFKNGLKANIGVF